MPEGTLSADISTAECNEAAAPCANLCLSAIIKKNPAREAGGVFFMPEGTLSADSRPLH
jgi:hypothetical protein